MKRRLFLAGGSGALLAGCSPIGTALNDHASVRRVLRAAEALDARVIGGSGLAREYTLADVRRDPPVTSLPVPHSDRYAHLIASRYEGFSLRVDGLVQHPLRLTYRVLQGARKVTMITRHDCVEGWSVVVAWTGIPLARILAAARPLRAARFAVFHCMDRDETGAPYYESLDVHQAYHPQTLLVLEMNGRPLSPDHGAPVRLCVPLQLGYKSAKWIERIELVPSLRSLYGGNGGYWEDRGYEWFAGI